MRPPFAPLAVAFALVAGLGTIGCADRGSDPQRASPASMRVAGDCDDDVADALAAWGRAGFSGSVVVEGGEGPTCHAGVGVLAPGADDPITADSAFAVGSVTKTFVAAAILQLEADGMLARADRIGDRVLGLTGPVADATIEQLLLHTSGLTGTHGRDHQPIDRDQAVAAISELPVDESYRGTFLYSNAGYTLLALVIDDVTGGYRSYLTDRILPEGAGFWDGEPAPIGARAIGSISGEAVDERGGFDGPHWAMAGNGDAAMSTAQLVEWVRRLFAGEVIPSPAVEVMAEPVVAVDGGQAVTRGWVQLDATHFGESVLATAGGGGDTGHNVVVAWVPTTEQVIAVSSNTDVVTAEELLRAVAPGLLAGEPLPRPDEPTEADPGQLAAAAGTYRLSSGDSFSVEVRDGGLDVRPSGAEALQAILPTGRSTSEDIAAHEAATRALLAGETEAGREELEILEEDGQLTGFEVLATAVVDGELRTFVELIIGGESVVGWYALDDAGGIEAVDLAGYPVVHLVLTASGFRPADGLVGGEWPTVHFEGDLMTLRSAAGTVVAERT